MPFVTTERVEKIRERHRASTDGWRIMTDEYGRPVAVWIPTAQDSPILMFEKRQEDMIFAAHARDDIGYLLERLDEETRLRHDWFDHAMRAEGLLERVIVEGSTMETIQAIKTFFAEPP